MNLNLNNEFIQYRTGFMDGKNQAIQNIAEIKDASIEDLLIENVGWYSYGYYDALKFYISEYLENDAIDEKYIHGVKYKELIEEKYSNRVLYENSVHDSNVAIGKFRMKL